MPVDPLLPDAVLRYADHPDGLLDVHLPAPADAPGSAEPTDRAVAAPERVVVLLHGGFWKTAWDRRHTRSLARALADDGFVVATPEYRRVGPGGHGGWPRTGADVRAAVRVLPTLLAAVGVTPGPVTAVGHSAGGHLALWLATTDAPLTRVVALAPVCDLDEAIRLGLGSDAARAFLGDVEPAAADPMVLLARRPAAAVTLLHGVADDVVPVDLSRRLVGRHPWIDLVELAGDHFDVIDPQGPAYDVLLRALRAPSPDLHAGEANGHRTG